MRQVKLWQIVLFVAAAGAILFTVLATRGPGLDLADSIVMVDVETGELFSFSIDGKRGVGIPNYNPRSGRLTLLPVARDDSGAWMLTERARPMVADLGVEPHAVMDVTSGKVKTVGTPRRVSRKPAPSS